VHTLVGVIQLEDARCEQHKAEKITAQLSFHTLPVRKVAYIQNVLQVLQKLTSQSTCYCPWLATGGCLFWLPIILTTTFVALRSLSHPVPKNIKYCTIFKGSHPILLSIIQIRSTSNQTQLNDIYFTELHVSTYFRSSSGRGPNMQFCTINRIWFGLDRFRLDFCYCVIDCFHIISNS
jgi:hypothetical protein